MKAAKKASFAFSTLNLTCRRICPALSAPMRKPCLARGSAMVHGNWKATILPRCGRKSRRARRLLGEVYGAPHYGIKTALNEAFIVSRERRDELMARDARSAELLVPFLRGENIRRWRVESEDIWLLNIPFGWTRKRFAPIAATTDNNREADFWRALGQTYPAVTDHLAPFEEKARIRTDQGQYWWELRACTYSNQFLKSKIVYPVISQGPKFAIDENAHFTNDKCFMVEADYFLLGLLNSRLTWFNLFGITSPLRGGQWRLELREQYMSDLPIPPRQGAQLSETAEQCSKAWAEKACVIAKVVRRIPDLRPPDRAAKLTNRLREWWKLDFKSFRAEIKKAFNADISLKQRNDWEIFLREEGEKVRRLTAEIEQAERDIDSIVYKLFDLTPDEIALLESSLAGQY